MMATLISLNADNFVDKSDPMDMNDKDMDAINTFDDNMLCPISQTKSMSRNSIKSNTSEDRQSVKSNKSNESVVNSDRNRLVPIKDTYCWDCHKIGVDFSCKACLRSYHSKCTSLKKLISQSPEDANTKLCPECIDIMKSEERANPSGAMQWLNGNVNALAELLKFTIETVRAADKNNSFYEPVSDEEYPEYQNIIVNPMDLKQVERNIKNKTYASTNSFLADIKWIHHNCIVFNSGVNNAFISEAKNILRVAKQECEEIEICPDCYNNYYTMEEETYFAAVCRRPHAIVWAKLKGHPHWPAKVVRYNEIRNEVDVRFFGTHDKCWLKLDKCFLMSKTYPNNKKPSKFDPTKFDEAIRDMNLHLDQLQRYYPSLFRFYEKHTVFTFDKLYLSSQPIEPQSIIGDNCAKNVLNNYNGIPLKKLKVKTSKFDVRTHLQESQETNDKKMSQNKRLKKSINGSPKAKRCISQSMTVRQELNNSYDSDMSANESRSDPKLDSPFNSNNNSFSTNFSDINGVDENEMKMNAIHETLNKSIIDRVSEENSQKLTIDEIDDNNVNNSLFCTNNDLNASLKKFKINSKSPQKHKNESFEDILKKRLKVMEIKIRGLEEDKKSAENEMECLRRTNVELERSIDDMKRKQWCTNCLKEAILPCCWNTCYCTVECQHKHWAIHSKTCRRRQQSNRQ
ncbi:MYND-type zinc finger-containing chromatin reader ZMYND8-like [Oppia nitens]|uniref:MYND-type zinc finger-containing chromatin reader ZMYND8-like n=1 Tax=Oppia nitens TaxID=1686743 RepID=UPI0023DA595E|nr:MYND-type zinc finger-containing chromatin reader ZMYND8-like [Oppia nitens]